METCRNLMLPALGAVHEGRDLDQEWNPEIGWSGAYQSALT
jgi:hypothetical protein